MFPLPAITPDQGSNSLLPSLFSPSQADTGASQQPAQSTPDSSLLNAPSQSPVDTNSPANSDNSATSSDQIPSQSTSTEATSSPVTSTNATQTTSSTTAPQTTTGTYLPTGNSESFLTPSNAFVQTVFHATQILGVCTIVIAVIAIAIVMIADDSKTGATR